MSVSVPPKGLPKKNSFKEASIPTTKQKGRLATKQLFENNKNCLLKEQGVTLVECEA
jgi:hypothetical protein